MTPNKITASSVFRNSVSLTGGTIVDSVDRFFASSQIIESLFVCQILYFNRDCNEIITTENINALVNNNFKDS